jgi:hypothetical protein
MICLLCATLLLAAGPATQENIPPEEAFLKARTLLELKRYADTVPYLQRLAKHGNKAAMYQLATLSRVPPGGNDIQVFSCFHATSPHKFQP